MGERERGRERERERERGGGEGESERKGNLTSTRPLDPSLLLLIPGKGQVNLSQVADPQTNASSGISSEGSLVSFFSIHRWKDRFFFFSSSSSVLKVTL